MFWWMVTDLKEIQSTDHSFQIQRGKSHLWQVTDPLILHAMGQCMLKPTAQRAIFALKNLKELLLDEPSDENDMEGFRRALKRLCFIWSIEMDIVQCLCEILEPIKYLVQYNEYKLIISNFLKKIYSDKIIASGWKLLEEISNDTTHSENIYQKICKRLSKEEINVWGMSVAMRKMLHIGLPDTDIATNEQ